MIATNGCGQVEYACDYGDFVWSRAGALCRNTAVPRPQESDSRQGDRVSFVRTLCGLEVIVTTHTAQFTSIMITGTEVKLALNIAAEVYGKASSFKRKDFLMDYILFELHTAIFYLNCRHGTSSVRALPT